MYRKHHWNYFIFDIFWEKSATTLPTVDVCAREIWNQQRDIKEIKMDKNNPNRQIPSFTSVCGSRRICAKNKMLYTRPKPDVLQSILQSKANADYKSRRLWYELNMPECASRLFDGQTLSDLPESLICTKGQGRHTTADRHSESKPKSSSNYMLMRKEREHFRRKLVELILSIDDEDGEKKDTVPDKNFPDQTEREVLRYYYYIKHGIDTIHVSTISKKTLRM